MYELCKRLPNATILAGVRDPPTATNLNEFAGKNGNVRVVRLVVDDEASNREAIEEVKKVTGQLDIVIANAGKFAFLREKRCL